MSIVVENLTHVYMKGSPLNRLPDDVSFEIHDGEFVGLIGHTGSESPRWFSISSL